jgi:hypothetical protein
MSFWTAIAVIAIVAIIFGGRKHRHRVTGRRRREQLHGVEEDVQVQSPREIELQREVEELRERVQVLERIATDGRDTQRLSDEIERLRSQGKEENR